MCWDMRSGVVRRVIWSAVRGARWLELASTVVVALLVGVSASASATNGSDALRVAGLQISDDLRSATITFTGDQAGTAFGPEGAVSITDHRLRAALQFTDSTSVQTVTWAIKDRSTTGEVSIVY